MHLVKTQAGNSGTQTGTGIVMQIKLMETTVPNLISWKQTSGLGKQQLMNATPQVVMDFTVIVTEVVRAIKTTLINSHTLIMVPVATSKSIPLNGSMFNLTLINLTTNSVHL